jgi:hypothetical protein
MPTIKIEEKKLENAVINDAVCIIEKITFTDLKEFANHTATKDDGETDPIVTEEAEQNVSHKVISDSTLDSCKIDGCTLEHSTLTEDNTVSTDKLIEAYFETPPHTIHMGSFSVDVDTALTINNALLAAMVPPLADNTAIDQGSLSALTAFYEDGAEAGTIVKPNITVTTGNIASITVPDATTDATKVRVNLLIVIPAAQPEPEPEE